MSSTGRRYPGLHPTATEGRAPCTARTLPWPCRGQDRAGWELGELGPSPCRRPAARIVPWPRRSCRFPLEVGRAAKSHHPPAAMLRGLEPIILWAQELAHYKGKMTSRTWNGISFCSNCHLLTLPLASVRGGEAAGQLRRARGPLRAAKPSPTPGSSGPRLRRGVGARSPRQRHFSPSQLKLSRAQPWLSSDLGMPHAPCPGAPRCFPPRSRFWKSRFCPKMLRVLLIPSHIPQICLPEPSKPRGGCLGGTRRPRWSHPTPPRAAYG